MSVVLPNPFSPYADADTLYRHLIPVILPALFGEPKVGSLAPTLCDRQAVVPDEPLRDTADIAKLPDGICPACTAALNGADTPTFPITNCTGCDARTHHNGLCAQCRQEKHKGWWTAPTPITELREAADFYRNQGPADPPPAQANATWQADAEARIAHWRRTLRTEAPADADAPSATRRDVMRLLLHRAGRGKLTAPEAGLLRQHLGAEIAEALMRWAERNSDPTRARLRRPQIVRENACSRTDAVLAVVQPVLDQLMAASDALARCGLPAPEPAEDSLADQPVPTALRNVIAAAIYERNNPDYRWADAHPDDRLAYGFDADAVLAAIRPTAPVINLYERWVEAGPPPLGAPTARWWDARLTELRGVLLPPPPAKDPS
ncbi:hypothetical protein ABTZ78_17125 [Streptomyces bauhiniae]|uniref:hypothetical protein n=1 Tax=Streptomyces bauhiniae TaxID=2340725 RepID=UPI00331C9EE7